MTWARLLRAPPCGCVIKSLLRYARVISLLFIGLTNKQATYVASSETQATDRCATDGHSDRHDGESPRQASDDIRSRAAMFVYEASLRIDLYIRLSFPALVALPYLNRPLDG